MDRWNVVQMHVRGGGGTALDDCFGGPRVSDDKANTLLSKPFGLLDESNLDERPVCGKELQSTDFVLLCLDASLKAENVDLLRGRFCELFTDCSLCLASLPQGFGRTPKSERESCYCNTTEANDNLVMAIDPVSDPRDRVKRKS